MSTFLGQLVGFAVIVWMVWRFVVPLLRKLMADQQQSVRKQLDDAAAAAHQLATASQAHSKALADAQTDAQRVTAEARAEAVQRAAELVRNHVADPARQSATVDRFLDELDAMAPKPADPADIEPPVLARMRSTSRQAMDGVLQGFGAVADGLDDQGLSGLADDLSAVAKLLNRETVVTRYLTVPSDDPTAKVRLVERLLAGKVGDPALALLKTAVAARWSTHTDLIDAIEHVARQALLLRAERGGQADGVEDQLFRFSRILDAQPRRSEERRVGKECRSRWSP